MDSHGGETAVADPGDDRLQVPLEHAVELDALTVGQAQRALRQDAEIVMDQPLLGGNPAAGHFGAHHERPGLFLLFLGKGGPEVPVVLLVGAVEFEQDVFGFVHMGERGVGEVFRDVAAKALGLEFDFFDAGFGHVWQ